MKRFICILLVLALAGFALSGCDRRTAAPEAAETEAAEGIFEPETTAVGGLTQAVKEQGSSDEEASEAAMEEQPEISEESVGEAEPENIFDGEEQEPVADQPIDEEGADAEPTTDPNEMPFATPSPQPNASVSQYTEVTGPGLGFRFSYPTGWVNIPGRSTVCYVQPLEGGTVYPARVAVTMKRMPHATGMTEAKTQLANYVRKLMTQYPTSTFKVNSKLDEETKFMGKKGLSTTYLAYDGDTEIKGYLIITYFERYIYVFHFLCAYNDYSSFEATLRYMRDSVQPDDSVAPK